MTRWLMLGVMGAVVGCGSPEQQAQTVLEDVPVERAYHKVCTDGNGRVLDDKDCVEQPPTSTVQGGLRTTVTPGAGSGYHHWVYVLRETQPMRPVAGTRVVTYVTDPKPVRRYVPVSRSTTYQQPVSRPYKPQVTPSRPSSVPPMTRPMARPSTPAARPTPRPSSRPPMTRPMARPHVTPHH